MKRILIIIAIIFTLTLVGQNPSEKVGKIEVQIINHTFKSNSNYELTKKKTNRKNRPFLMLYFDSSGTLLKSIGFGKMHNKDLRLLDNIHIYHYDNNGIKSKIDVWETDYEGTLSHKYYITFDLDSSKSKIVSEKMYEIESDSIFIRTDYWYDINEQYQGIIFDSTYYYKREYNEKDQIISLQQIYNGKLRWDWNYTYSDNRREGIFQTYYNDGKDYSKKEIRTYNNQGFLTETEEVQVSKDGLNEKTILYYDNDRVIKKIEYYRSFSREQGYELISYSEIRVKSKETIDSQIAQRINEHIFME